MNINVWIIKICKALKQFFLDRFSFNEPLNGSPTTTFSPPSANAGKEVSSASSSYLQTCP